jgi:hypothetical protein
MDKLGKVRVLLINGIIGGPLCFVFAALGILSTNDGDPRIYLYIVTVILLILTGYFAYQGIRLAPDKSRWRILPFALLVIFITVGLVIWELWVHLNSL